MRLLAGAWGDHRNAISGILFVCVLATICLH